MSASLLTTPAEALRGPLRLAPTPSRRWPLLLLLVVAYGLVPLVANDYWLSAILIPTLVMSLAGLGLNLLTGYAGLASLGTAAFMSVGAFSAYNFLLRIPGLPLPIGILLGGIVAGAVGTVVGLPSLRIKGFYLVAPTLAAQFFFEWLFTNDRWFFNNHASGAISAPSFAVAGVDLGSPLGRYMLTAVITGAMTWLAWNLVRSRIGRDWMAIRDMDTAAAVIGIRLARTKLLAFMVSSFFAGIAGALWSFAYLGTADAHAFSLDKAFEALFIVIIGGSASIFGSFVGGAFIVLTPILLDRLTDATLLSRYIDQGALSNLEHILFGALIIVILVKEPDGFARLLRAAATRIALWPLRS